MFKRITWFTVGVASGAAGSVVAARKVRALVEDKVPPSVRDGVTRTAGAVKRQVSEAIDEGRAASAAREAELRSRLGRPESP